MVGVEELPAEVLQELLYLPDIADDDGCVRAIGLTPDSAARRSW
jgi:hypothetical protein